MLIVKELFTLFLLIKIIFCTKSIYTTYKPNEAQVALIPCSKLTKFNLYFNLDKKQWSVVRSRCIESIENDANKIYDLCKMLYPQLNILNIVQLNDDKVFQISSQNYTLKPFKCLHGNYQSNALYIPPKCEFQHLVSDTQCETQTYWQLESAKKCEQTLMKLNNSFMLKWCDGKIARYSGIEFVCCPKDEDLSQKDEILIEEDDDIDDEDESYDYLDENDVNVKEKVQQESINQVKQTQQKEDEDLIAIDGDKQEQARYNLEKSAIINEFEKKQISLIEEWKEKKNKVRIESDVENINKIYNNRLIDLNNQKARSLLENDLNHDTIVQSIINEKKVSFLKQLNEALAKSTPTENILNIIYNIISTLERDRLHQVNLYKRLKAYYPDEADRQLSEIAKHLKYIDLSVDNLINRVNTQNKALDGKTQPLVNEIFDRYKYVRQDSKDIVKEFEEKKETKTTSTTISLVKNEDDYEDDEIDSEEDQENLEAVTPSINLIVPRESTQAYNSENYEEYYDDYEDDSIELYKEDNYNNDKYNYDDDDNSEDDDDDDSEEKSILRANDHFAMDESHKDFISIKHIKSSNSSLILIVCICLASLFSMVLIAIYIRKRSSNYKEKFMFSKLETTSPEERHVSQMQINGYENPTYRFFEQHTNA